MVEDFPFFHIVLVDIKKAAEPFNGRVECVKKNMYDPSLRYVAISYRWGEVPEQVVDTAANDDDDDDHDNSSYLAHITSFSLTDFYELCQYMAEEVDLQHIDYVWVDAISVDQQNKERRKETIRHMSKIYEQATYILAVPDLHLAFLNLHSANKVQIELVRKHALYIYHVISNHDEECDDIERIWCYNLLCDRALPPSKYLLFYRHQLKSKLASLKKSSSHHHQPHDDLACFHLMQPVLSSSTPISQHVQHHVEKYWFLNQTLNKSLVAEIQHIEKKCIQTPHRVWRVDASSDHLDHRHRPRQLDLAWLNHPWHGLLTTTIIPQWNQTYHDTTEELRQAFDFLDSLMKDWSNRAWVISEYLIAKQKKKPHTNQQVPMKFIFLLLRSPFTSEQRGSKFFHVFDRRPLTDQQQHHHPWRSMGLQFRQQLMSRLGHRDFIDMIVESNATRPEDRFHSILPLWKKYKHVIMDKDTIASWGIVDKMTVVLKLYDLMDDVADKIRLLHACAQWSPMGGPGRHQLLFPTFATLLKPSFLKIFELENAAAAASTAANDDDDPNKSVLPIAALTVDQLNITAIDLKTDDFPHHRLRISVKQYYKRIETEQDDPFFKPYYQSFDKKINREPLKFETGKLVAIVVPLFNNGEGSRIHLIGDESSNRWILVRYIQFYHWRDLFTGPYFGLTSFDIY